MAFSIECVRLRFNGRRVEIEGQALLQGAYIAHENHIERRRSNVS